MFWSFDIEIGDVFPGFGGVRCKGAFHLGACKAISNKGNLVEAEFDDFIFSIAFPSDFTVEIFRKPLMRKRLVQVE